MFLSAIQNLREGIKCCTRCAKRVLYIVYILVQLWNYTLHATEIWLSCWQYCLGGQGWILVFGKGEGGGVYEA